MKKVPGAAAVLLLSACSHIPLNHPAPAPVDDRLPRWDAATMSDGCSTTFRLVNFTLFDVDIKLNTLTFTPAETACCEVHDHRYYAGGSRDDRFAADAELERCLVGTVSRLNLIKRAEERARARLMFDAVRDHGGPEGRLGGISWANGPRLDPVFAYTDKPREERPE